MVLTFNSTVSREISGTNFTPTRAITYTYIYMYIHIYHTSSIFYTSDSVSLTSLAHQLVKSLQEYQELVHISVHKCIWFKEFVVYNKKIFISSLYKLMLLALDCRTLKMDIVVEYFLYGLDENTFGYNAQMLFP